MLYSPWTAGKVWRPQNRTESQQSTDMLRTKYEVVIKGKWRWIAGRDIHIKDGVLWIELPRHILNGTRPALESSPSMWHIWWVVPDLPEVGHLKARQKKKPYQLGSKWKGEIHTCGFWKLFISTANPWVGAFPSLISFSFFARMRFLYSRDLQCKSR